MIIESQIKKFTNNLLTQKLIGKTFSTSKWHDGVTFGDNLPFRIDVVDFEFVNVRDHIGSSHRYDAVITQYELRVSGINTETNEQFSTLISIKDLP